MTALFSIITGLLTCTINQTGQNVDILQRQSWD